METTTEFVNGFTVTVDEVAYGIWHYRISNRNVFYTGIVSAISPQAAIRKAMENIK